MEMVQTFFTWDVLGTMAGATAATMLITQLLKGVGFIDRLPTRVFSYVVALVILVVAHVFGCEVSAQSIVLCFINAAVVALAAQGGYTLVSEGVKSKK